MPNTSIQTTFDRVFSTTHPDVMPQVWDNVTSDIPTIHYLSEAGRIKYVTGGAALDFNIFKEAATVVGYTSGSATLTPVTIDPVTRGRYEWKNLALPFKIPGPELRKNMGPAQIANLMVIIVEAVRASFVEGLGGSVVGIHSNEGETNIGAVTGLQNLVKVTTADNTTGTTGGISRATFTVWRNTIGNAVTDFSANGIARWRAALFAAQRGNETTDAIITTTTAFSNLVAALTATYQFNLPMEMRVQSTGVMDVGVPGINFHGALVIKDASATETRGLNTKYIALRVHRETNMIFSEWVSMLPVGEDSIAASMIWMGNLVATNMEQHWGIAGSDTD